MRKLEIQKRPGGGLMLKAQVKHGPGELHTLDLSADDVAALGKFGIGPQHRHNSNDVLGIETLDADLFDLRKKAREYTNTEIMGDVGGEDSEESLKGL